MREHMPCFKVENSSGDRNHEVLVVREDEQVRMSCECEAAENGIHCKHRINLVVGTPKKQNLTSGNPADVATLRQWLAGPPLDSAVPAVTELEGEIEVLKARFSKAKKALGIALVTGRLPG